MAALAPPNWPYHIIRNEPRLTGEDPLPFWALQAASAYYSVLPEKFIADAGPYLPQYVALDVITAMSWGAGPPKPEPSCTRCEHPKSVHTGPNPGGDTGCVVRDCGCAAFSTDPMWKRP